MTSIDDLVRVINTVLANGAKITISIEGIDAPTPDTGTQGPAVCKVCGWKSDRVFKSDASRARALRAHKSHCKGKSAAENDFVAWLEDNQQK